MKRSAALRLSTLFAAVAACALAFSPIAHAQKSASAPTFVTVDHPGALTSTSINGINDFDEFVGVYDDAQGNYHAFEGKKGDPHFKPIDYPGAVQTYIFRINNLGEIVGNLLRQKPAISTASCVCPTCSSAGLPSTSRSMCPAQARIRCSATSWAPASAPRPSA